LSLRKKKSQWRQGVRKITKEEISFQLTDKKINCHQREVSLFTLLVGRFMKIELLQQDIMSINKLKDYLLKLESFKSEKNNWTLRQEHLKTLLIKAKLKIMSFKILPTQMTMKMHERHLNCTGKAQNKKAIVKFIN